MKYRIQRDASPIKNFYEVDGVIFDISSLKKCGNKIDFTDKNYNELLFITLSYDKLDRDGNVVSSYNQYINLEDYIEEGDKFEEDGGKMAVKRYDCDKKSMVVVNLPEVFKKKQTEEVFNRILNNGDIKGIYDSLPDFFRWKGTNIITQLNSSETLSLKSVSPQITIDPLYEERDGKVVYTEALKNIFIEEAKKRAAQEADSILAKVDLKTVNIKLETANK